VSGSVPTYQVPNTTQAKTDDERTESTTVKQKEAESGKEAPVKVQTSRVDVKA
jgi:hypothetical protein